MKIRIGCSIRLHECIGIQETGWLLFLKISCRLNVSLSTYLCMYKLCLYVLNKICARILTL